MYTPDIHVNTKPRLERCRERNGDVTDAIKQQDRKAARGRKFAKMSKIDIHMTIDGGRKRQSKRLRPALTSAKITLLHPTPIQHTEHC